jgi:hypothetical protein
MKTEVEVIFVNSANQPTIRFDGVRKGRANFSQSPASSASSSTGGPKPSPVDLSDLGDEFEDDVVVEKDEDLE